MHSALQANFLVRCGCENSANNDRAEALYSQAQSAESAGKRSAVGGTLQLAFPHRPFDRVGSEAGRADDERQGRASEGSV